MRDDLKAKVRDKGISSYGRIFSAEEVSSQNLESIIKKILNDFVSLEHISLQETERAKIVKDLMDDFLGYFIPETNRHLQSLLIAPGLPGGMMGSLMNDLKDNLVSINKAYQKQGKTTINTDELLIQLFDEVAYVWPRVGYPPLVTPYSQYVKNLAMFNIIQMAKGKARWTMISDDTWAVSYTHLTLPTINSV